MERQTFNLVIYCGIVVVLILLCAWGWYLYFNSGRRLSEATDRLRDASIKVQRLTIINNEFAKISRLDRISYKTIRRELKQSREIIEYYRKRDKDLGSINNEGRRAIERVINLATEFGGGFDRLYQDYKAIGKISNP